MRENVLNVTAVMADGSIVKTAQRARKSSAGYDLTRLLVGSEGTLGIITEVTVRLYGIPESILVGRVPVRDAGGRLQRRNPVDPARPRRRPHGAARPAPDPVPSTPTPSWASRRSRRCSWSSTAPRPARATRSRASRRSPRRKARSASTGPRTRRTAAACGRRGTRPTGPSRRRGPARTCSPPTCACRSRGSPNACSRRSKDIEALGLVAPIVGHVGDGNFHTSPVFDRNNPKEMAAIETFLDRLTKRAIAMEGTCTGEHGVGQGKTKYLKAELGDGLAVMRAHEDGPRPARHHEPGQDSSELGTPSPWRGEDGTPRT